MTDEQPPLFDGEPEHCALCGDAGHTHDEHWLFGFEAVERVVKRVKELDARVEALGTEATSYQLQLEAAENERDELKAELRKYVPSDGVMHEILAYREAIAECTKLVELFAQLWRDRILPGNNGPLLRSIDAWLALPIVKAVRKAE